jgi:CBS domain-containing protein
MRASEIMTRNVITVAPSATLSEAIGKMVQNRVSGLPVTDLEGRLLGMLTEGDLLRRAELHTEKQRSQWQQFLLGPSRTAAEYVKARSRVVADVMTTDVVSVSEDTEVAEVVALMESRNIRRVPVRRAEVLVGIISRADLIRVVGEALGVATATAGSDDDIRQRLFEELRRQRWFGAQSVAIAVKDGVVTFDGVLFEEPARAALLVAARNIPGVKSVEDHMTLAEPVPFVG